MDNSTLKEILPANEYIFNYVSRVNFLLTIISFAHNLIRA